MPKPIMRSAISFGLVSVPVMLMNATESHAVSFRQIHLADGGRIRYRKVCDLEDREVGAEEIGRAYETATGQLVEVTDADLDQMPLPTARAIEIVTFVPAASIDPVQIGAASYYLAIAEPTAAKAYVLLVRALRRNAKVAVAKFALRDRERLGLLRVTGETLVLHALRWPDEIRSPSGAAPPAEAELSEDELAEAQRLIDTLSNVDIDTIRDSYRDALEEVLVAKSEGRQFEHGAEKPAVVVDLMAALQESVRSAQAQRGEALDDEARAHPRKPPAAKKTQTEKKTTSGKKPRHSA